MRGIVLSSARWLNFAWISWFSCLPGMGSPSVIQTIKFSEVQNVLTLVPEQPAILSADVTGQGCEMTNPVGASALRDPYPSSPPSARH